MIQPPFPIKPLFEKIAGSFPLGQVTLEGEVISVLKGKIKVSANGVEGSGPTSDHVRKIYNEFFNVHPPLGDKNANKENSFQCPHCPLVLKKQGGLTNHLRKNHPQAFLQLIDEQERARNVILNDPKSTKDERERAAHWVNYLAGVRKFDFFLSCGNVTRAIEQLDEYISEYFLSRSSVKNPTLESLPYAKTDAQVRRELVDRVREKLAKYYKEQGIPAGIGTVLDEIASK